MAAIGANPLFIVGGVSFLAALVASLMVQFVILQQGRKLGGAGWIASRKMRCGNMCFAKIT